MTIVDARPDAGAFSTRSLTHPTDGLLGVTWHRVFSPIAVFLAGFGVLNWAELPLGWKDRTEQISRYLDKTVGLGSEWVTPALWSMKTVELALGIVAIVALRRRDPRWLMGAIAGWMGVFTFFAFMDVWAEDRAELQEHTVYFGVFTQLLVIVLVVGVANQVVAWLRSSSHDDG